MSERRHELPDLPEEDADQPGVPQWALDAMSDSDGSSWPLIVRHRFAPSGPTHLDASATTRFLTERDTLTKALLERLEAEDAGARWLTTTEAAECLQVNRSTLDQVAEAAHAAFPDLVTQVGQGQSRRSWRWREDGLGRVLSATQEKPAPTKKPRRANRRGTAGAQGRGGSLRSLVKD